jgi:hypothetical protein
MIGHIYFMPGTNMKYDIMDKWWDDDMGVRVYEVEFINPDIKYHGKGIITGYTFDKLKLIA